MQRENCQAQVTAFVSEKLRDIVVQRGGKVDPFDRDEVSAARARFLASQWRFNFEDEVGVDSGGLRREVLCVFFEQWTADVASHGSCSAERACVAGALAMRMLLQLKKFPLPPVLFALATGAHSSMGTSDSTAPHRAHAVGLEWFVFDALDAASAFVSKRCPRHMAAACTLRTTTAGTRRQRIQLRPAQPGSARAASAGCGGALRKGLSAAARMVSNNRTHRHRDADDAELVSLASDLIHSDFALDFLRARTFSTTNQSEPASKTTSASSSSITPLSGRSFSISSSRGALTKFCSCPRTKHPHKSHKPNRRAMPRDKTT